jgi:hypothetical protein
MNHITNDFKNDILKKYAVMAAATSVISVSLREYPNILLAWTPVPGVPKIDANGHLEVLIYIYRDF